MSQLTDEDIAHIADALAPRVIDGVRARHHEFWIDPEVHYLDHKALSVVTQEELYDLKNLIQMWKKAKTVGAQTFLGFAIVGAIALAAFGFLFHK